MKKLVATIVAFALGMIIASVPVSAVGTQKTDLTVGIKTEEDATSGYCGAPGNEENVMWSFDVTTGTLTISGTGDMKGFLLSTVPWSDYYITEVIIENGVTDIGTFAFEDCTGLTSVLIPDSVISIRSSAFSNCISLTSVEIPDCVTDISDFTFEGCSSLTSVTIPESVTYIGFGAFSGCISLESVTIENPDCEIRNNPSTFSNGYYENDNNYFYGTIYGYTDSTAQAYAEKWGYNFESLGEAPAQPETTTTTTATTTVEITTTTTAKATTEPAPETTAETAPAVTTTDENTTDVSQETTTTATEQVTTTDTTDITTEVTPSITTTEKTTTVPKATTTAKVTTKAPVTTTSAPGTTAPEQTAKDLGDVDRSGNIDSSDASIVLQEYALLATGHSGDLTPEQTSSADVNADGSVDSSDASTILRYYAYTATGGKDPFDLFLKS